MPNQEDMRELLGAKCFGKLDLLQGYWQMPLGPEAQEVFTVTPDGLFTPTRVFLEQVMAGASRRTKRVARNRVIEEDAWTAERVRAWRAAQDLVRKRCHSIILVQGASC